MLLSYGAPLIPAGGSCCNRLKSLINRFLDGVDIFTAYNQRKNNQSSLILLIPNLYEFNLSITYKQTLNIPESELFKFDTVFQIQFILPNNNRHAVTDSKLDKNKQYRVPQKDHI